LVDKEAEVVCGQFRLDVIKLPLRIDVGFGAEKRCDSWNSLKKVMKNRKRFIRSGHRKRIFRGTAE
jgi:hypothetical protein